MKKTQKLEMELDEHHHVVRLSHIPYGFFEKQLHGYFSQFGHVKKVRVMRNRKGNHTGIAFVEFKNAEVARIAAKTMDNYLLAENRIRCRVLGQDIIPKTILNGKLFAKIIKPGENRARHARKLFALKDAQQEEKQRNNLVDKLREKMKKIKEMGINYDFNFETKLKNQLKASEKMDGINENGKEDLHEMDSDSIHQQELGKAA